MLGIYMVVPTQVSNPDYPPDGPIIVMMLLIFGKPRNICLKVISHQYMGTCGWSSSRGPVLIIPQMVPHVLRHTAHHSGEHVLAHMVAIYSIVAQHKVNQSLGDRQQ